MSTKKRYTLIFLGLFYLVLSWQYFFSRPIKSNWSYNEAYLMRFQWLDSVNFYLEQGKILMMPGNMRLEEISTGEDQGYPFILSLIGKFSGLSQMTFRAFIKFNYLFFVSLGIISSLLLYFSFQSLFISVLFYFFYLRLDIYQGGLDHHWMLGCYVLFYLSFLITFLYKRQIFNPLWFIFYFIIAGFANIVREGDGVIGLLLVIATLIILMIQEGVKRYLTYIPKKILIIIFLLFIYNIPWLMLEGVRRYRDHIYFNGESSIMITHHGLWHNAFMGLGFIPNTYGIKWDDGNNLPFVRQIKPHAQYMTNEYYAILRGLYFKYALESPKFWLINYLAKLIEIHKFLYSLFPHQLQKFVPRITRSYAFYILLWAMFIVSRKSKQLQSIFLIVLSGLLISSLPGLVGMPWRMYLRGFQAAYIMTWFVFILFIYLRIKTFFRFKYV